MDLFDFFFPDQAQAKHLRDIARNSARLASSSVTSAARQSDELAMLRGDVNFLTVVLATILKRLSETKTMSLDDVRDLLGEVDALDGVSDSGLEPGVLRGLLGVLKQEDKATAQSDNGVIRIVTDPRPRYRR